MKKSKGISLIVLIITIIIVIILAAVVILTLSKNNPIESAKEARFKEDIKMYQDELNMYVSSEYQRLAGQRDRKITATGYEKDSSSEEYNNSVYKYLSSFKKKHENKIIIEDDEIVYVGKDKKEREWTDNIVKKNPMLTVKYLYENGEEAAQTYEEIITDGEYKVNSPIIEGYEPEYYIISGKIQKDTEVIVTYYPWSEGFIYKGYNASGNETDVDENIVKYEIVGVVGGRFTQKVLVIPREYNNKPITVIRRNAIYSVKMKKAIIPETIEEIDDNAFLYCSTIEYINLNASISWMDIHAFISLPNLIKLDIGPNVGKIGTAAFGNCSNLKDVTIYSNQVLDLSANVFHGCNLLQEIKISKDNAGYMVDNGILYSKDGKNLVIYPPGKTDQNFKILNTVQIINSDACAYNQFLKNIDIPSNIKSVSGYAFSNCNNVEFLKVSAERVESGYAFRSTGLKRVEIDNCVKYLGPNIFNGSTNIEEFKYLGNMSDWNNITKSVHWKGNSSIEKVICLDGEIVF